MSLKRNVCDISTSLQVQECEEHDGIMATHSCKMCGPMCPVSFYFQALYSMMHVYVS